MRWPALRHSWFRIGSCNGGTCVGNRYRWRLVVAAATVTTEWFTVSDLRRGMAGIKIIGKHGTADAPLVYDFRGQTVDGGGTDTPLQIEASSYIHVLGGNFHNSRNGVVWAKTSHHLRFQEVCAWDAKADANFKPFDVHVPYCQLIDCAAWGTGRKVFEFSYGGDDVYVSRCWGRYDGSTAEGWRIVFAVGYNNSRCVFSDCIGVCANLPPVPRHFRGVFADDRMDSGEPARTVVTHCCAMSPHNVPGFVNSNVSGIQFDNCIDATAGETPDKSLLIRLAGAWSSSPILDRIRELAGADPVADLLRLITP